MSEYGYAETAEYESHEEGETEESAVADPQQIASFIESGLKNLAELKDAINTAEQEYESATKAVDEVVAAAKSSSKERIKAARDEAYAEVERVKAEADEKVRRIRDEISEEIDRVREESSGQADAASEALTEAKNSYVHEIERLIESGWVNRGSLSVMGHEAPRRRRGK